MKEKKRYKKQRRLGLELPGLGKPGALTRRPYPPGQNGNKRKKYSDFALRLEEKQKIRYNYLLKEKQLKRFVRMAKTGLSKNWIEKLISYLELRLDNVIFKMGLAPSITSARQLCSHKHILVDGKVVNVPSYVLKKGQKVSLKDTSKENSTVLRAKDHPRMDVPAYLSKKSDYEAEVTSMPGMENVPFQFDPGLFAEYYAAR